LRNLQDTARKRQNLVAALVGAVKARSSVQIVYALYDMAEECRRNM
jgi:hypothetical protein